MLPNPIEVADNESQSYLGLLPNLAKFVLSAVPASCLLTHNTVSSLQALRQGFADVMVNFLWQHSPVPFPAIRAPFFAVGLAFSTCD